MIGRRLAVLLVGLAAIGVPAAALTVACVGRSCDARVEEGAPVPFCPLPGSLKRAIADGYREGRSPDVLGVAAETPVFTELEGLRSPWPALATSMDARVPLVFAGAGVPPGELPAGVTLDRVAPTVAGILRFEREHPEVRSGTAIEGVSRSAVVPRLVLLVAWKGVGTSELEARRDAWPFLGSLLDRGAGTLEAETGSLPLDPAATLATIGTGGLPFQHGITGSFVRNDQGEVVQAFGEGAPVQVIATLADDLDHADRSSLVGLVATDGSDRGIVGGGWYPDEDPVDAVIGDSAAAPLAVDVHLSTGYGADDVPDVLAVVVEGSVARMDRWTRRIVTAAERATGGSTLVVVAGTGAWEATQLPVPDEALVDAVERAVPDAVPAVAATVPGGVFLDQDALRTAQITGQVAVAAMRSAEGPGGERLLVDAFQGFAVSFARYC